MLFTKFLTMRKATRGSGRKRTDIARPRNGGQWTEARFRSFIVSALRNATLRWGAKWKCIDLAFVRLGPNPRTGRMCKLHRCASCAQLFPKGDMRADHIAPVIDPEQGFVGWDSYIERMFCEAEGFQALCHPCHDRKTGSERAMRGGGLKKVSAPRLRHHKGKR
jgi:hypothetical protein